MLWKIARYGLAVLRREGLSLAELIRALVSGRLGVLGIVQHNFMSAAEVATPRSEVVEKRLAACCFRGAVRRGNGWETVPMCAMNGPQREDLYASQIAVRQSP